MNTLLHDLRHSLRSLLRKPLFTAAAVLVLGLGIGANTAVFSVIEAVLLRPLAYPHPEQLVVLLERLSDFPFASVSYPDYLDWRAAQHSFTDIAIEHRSNFNVSFSPASGLPPERINAAEVSGNFLSVLGLRPTVGRDFVQVEDTPGGPKVALISDALWRRRFGADPKIVGQSLLVDGISREIVGVLPPEARFPRNTEILVPLGDQRADPGFNRRDSHPGLVGLGRLKPGVSLAQGHADLNAIAAELERQHPESNTRVSVNDQAMLDYQVGDYRQSLWLLLVAVGCVLLIACANVANLQLARAAGRARELAVRAALGAGRWRLLRQTLTESMVLGLLGGGVALLLALWSMDAISALSPANVPRFHEIRLNLAALGFTMVAALGTGILVGIWPAWRMSGFAVMTTALHESSARGSTGGTGQQRTRASLVVAQLVLTVALLACAGLTLKSFWRMENKPLGFRREGVLMVSISLPDAKYPKEKTVQFSNRLLERLRSLQSVEAAAVGGNVPFDEHEWDSDFHLTGTPPNQPGHEPQVEINYASSDYFRTMGIPLLRGRDFDAREKPDGLRSVIIDDLFAQRYFAGRDPIGQHIDDNQTPDKNAPPLTVVGVVGHTINDTPGGNPILANMVQMHFCADQMTLTNLMLMVHVVSGDPLRLTEAVRREVLAIDPDLPIAAVTTMEKSVTESFAPQRLTTVLLGAFAALALMLAGTGLYGLVALNVTQRTRELGIRMALGAQRAAVLRLVLGQCTRLIGIGLALGLLAAYGTGRMLASVVHGVSATDWQVMAVVALLLATVGLLASYLPARRATNIDPLTALREE